MRTITAALLLVASTQVFAATGVAFVHGTGKQTNAYNDYWQAGMIQSVIQGLPNRSNYVVINCDFGQYWWDSRAAGCLAGQLSSFISSKGITDLVVITHSNGGNVLRWVMSNPSYDSRYPNIISKIRWVNALAPSSTGTPLADAVMNGTVFESALGWLLGYKNDGVRQQQTSWMTVYNANNLYGTAGRPALPKGFWSVVGQDLYGGFWNSNAYCGGYSLNAGLAVTKLWLDSCADGFLNCSSQAAAGRVWFYDTQRTSGNRYLSHNQSRRQCFGLDTILRDDL